MGRKSKSNQSKQPAPTNATNRTNLTQTQKKLDELVDKLLRISTIPQHQNVLKSLENQKEISNITKKVKKLEINKDSKSSVDNRCSAATIEAFTKWSADSGAKFDGCVIENFAGFDLGLKTVVDIPQNTLIIAVPRKIMMSLDAARKSEMKGLIEKDKILQSMPNVALAIFLLLEKYKKEDSFWKAYIDILPKSYNTVLYFTVEELEELKGSPTLEIALRQIKSISRQYAYFYKIFNTSDDPVSRLLRDRFTFNEYCWAVSTVMTRQNTIPFQDDYHALIPLWDLCNHTNGTITTAYNPALDRSECLALKDFKAGEQLFIFYGARSNADLFIHNGFVYEENAYDDYWIWLGISRSDPLQGKKSDLLNKLAIPGTGDFFIKKGPKPIDGHLLAFLRIFNMNEEQLDHWLGSDKSGDLQYAECALDTALEKKSWSFLQARLRLLLSAYKTSLEDDEKLIKEGQQTSTSANQLLAIRMRATEKRIIRDTIEYVEQNINQ